MWGAWILGRIGVGVPDLHVQASAWLFDMMRRNPDMVRLFILGFISGSAAHTIADWLVTGGKRYVRMAGIRLHRDYCIPMPGRHAIIGVLLVCSVIAVMLFVTLLLVGRVPVI